MGFQNQARTAIEASTSWITSQRWYGDKARNITDLHVETIMDVDLHGLDAALAIIRFAYDHGPDARYFLPVIDGAESPGDGRLIRDALAEPACIRWFLEGFGDGRQPGTAPRWHWRHIGSGLPAIPEIPDDAIRQVSAEQSNSSVIISDELVLKIYQRLQPGINPDLEIGEFLSTNDRFAHAPKLYGLVDVELEGESTAIAAVHQFVSNNGDGWSWLIGELETIERGSLPGLVDAVSCLGVRTAEMHIGLASEPGNDAFAPEPFTRDDADRLIARVVAEMEESVEGLARHLDPHDVEQLHKGIGQLMSGAWSLVGSWKTRVHGDYHLGQTLRTVDDDFCLIDFEGEPSRPMDQRREKLSPLKDVAGMLRSLDYAASVVGSSTDDAGKREIIDDWLRASSSAFIQSYRNTVQDAETPIVPGDDQQFTEGLKLMTVEKALYEARYELNNRPDWLSIPLNGIRRLAGIPV